MLFTVKHFSEMAAKISLTFPQYSTTEVIGSVWNQPSKKLKDPFCLPGLSLIGEQIVCHVVIDN